MFLPFICLSAVNIVCWRFLAFACASGCFVAWRLVLRWYVSFMPLFARFVRGFVGLLLLSVILLLSGGRRLCVCFFSALNRCFSYCLLSFACLDGLFYLICLSLPLITHFLYFFDVFLYALRVACFFFALLAGFCTAWRLVLRNMSFFTVDCSFFLYALRVPVFFSHCLLWVLVS